MEMLRQNGIMAFSQEAREMLVMHNLALEYMEWIYSKKTDDAENAVELIKEIRNQEKQ